MNVNLLSKDNSTVEVEDYESTIELLFSKKSDKYDLYYFDNIFSNKFGPYLLDLREYLSESHINLYDNEITSQTCYYNDKLVGLVITFYIVFNIIFLLWQLYLQNLIYIYIYIYLYIQIYNKIANSDWLYFFNL